MPTVKDVIISRLKNMMDAHRNLTEYDTAGDCFLSKWKMEHSLRKVFLKSITRG